MFFTKYLTILAAALASPAVAAYNFDQGFSDLQSLTSAIYSTKKSLAEYNGGLLAGLNVANAIYSSQRKASMTRKNFQQLGNFTTENEQKAVDHFHDLIVAMKDGMEEGADKASLVKKSGFSYIAQGMILNLYQEKNRFETLMKGKTTEDHLEKYEASLGELDKSFNDLLDSFQEE